MSVLERLLGRGMPPPTSLFPVGHSHFSGSSYLRAPLGWENMAPAFPAVSQVVLCADSPVQKPHHRGFAGNLPCSSLYLCHSLLQFTLWREESYLSSQNISCRECYRYWNWAPAQILPVPEPTLC